jgi:lysozyme
MNISQNCLDLIKKWEGFRSEAYLDPVGIPTIGYGTIRYPNRQKVQMGDIISEPEAEDLMKLECDEFAEVVNRVVAATLNQNQFDALVSFCYNVGAGAFQGSTLLKKLNAGDFTGAAEQFLVWNQGTVNGVKKVIDGLTNRRKDEKALFEKTGAEGISLEKAEESPQNKVTWLEGYREAASDKTIIVAYNGSDVVEILTLDSPDKEDLITVLNQYPNAQNFHLAPPGKTVPTGERILIQKRQPAAITKVANPPALNHPLLVIGMGAEDDTPASLKQDIENLQMRLKALGYYQGKIDGNFGTLTDRGVKAFQAKEFGESEADGKVGKITWGKLWGQDAPTTAVTSIADDSPATPGKNYLKLTKTNKKDESGCFVLKMEYYKDGKLKDFLNVCSGAPGRQAFRTGTKSVPKSLEPLPEGKWRIENIKWAGGIAHKDDYSGKFLFNNGVGPVSTPLSYIGPGSTRRSAIEIHIDWNRRKCSPGTAGCVGLYTIADYQRFVSWLRDTDPRDFYVDWGLGTCPKP